MFKCVLRSVRETLSAPSPTGSGRPVPLRRVRLGDSHRVYRTPLSTHPTSLPWVHPPLPYDQSEPRRPGRTYKPLDTKTSRRREGDRLLDARSKQDVTIRGREWTRWSPCFGDNPTPFIHESSFSPSERTMEGLTDPNIPQPSG